MIERSETFIQPSPEDLEVAELLSVEAIAELIARERLAQQQLAEATKKLDQSMIDRRSGLLRNDAFEDISRIQLQQLLSFEEKRRDVPNQAIAIFGDLIALGAYNRRFGHNAGHKVIANFGGVLKAFLRPGSKDIAGRVGEGDEFAVLIFFRGDTPDEVEAVCQTVNKRFYELIYEATETGLIPGFKWRSSVYQIGEPYEELMNRADPKQENSPTRLYQYPFVRKKSF